MKIYRTTRYNENDGIIWVRYSTTRRQYAAAKNAWYSGAGRNKLTLQSAEIPDDAWTIEEAAADY